MPFLFLFFWCIIHIIYGIPTWRPTFRPTLIYPTWRPTLRPNFIYPTWRPTLRPGYPTWRPTLRPNFYPTWRPSFRAPTNRPTFTAPTNRPTTPTLYPTDNPTNPPTMSPTLYFVPMKNLYDIECNDLQDSYDVIYDISVDDCNYMCSRDRNCVMINYLHYLKSNNDNRCYLYDKVCDIEYTFNAQQSIVGYKTEEATCQNYPYYWRDKSNNQCYYYTSYELCNNGSVTNENYTSIILNAKNVNGISAIDACCQCGGGVYNYDSIQLFHFNKNNYDRFNDEVIRELYLDKQIKEWNNLMLYYVSTKNNVKNSETFDTLMFNLDDNIPNKVYLCELSSIDMEISKYFVLIKQYNIYINKQWTNLNDSYNPNIIETISYNNCTSQIDFSDNFIGFYPINALQLYAPTSFPTALPEAAQQNIPVNDKPKVSPAVVTMFVVCGAIIYIMGLILIYCWYVLYISYIPLKNTIPYIIQEN